VWGLRRPDRNQVEQTGYNARLITVEKSRAGRDGSKLLMKLENDLTFSLADYMEVDTDSAGPASVVDRVLQRVRAVYPRSVSRSDLAADPLCGGSVAGIRKALQRLISRGLIEVAENRPSKGGGSPTAFYRAITSREKSINVCPTGEEHSQGLESTVGQPLDVSHCSDVTGAEPSSQWDNPSPCPTASPSDTNESAPVGQVLDVSPKGNERSAAELDQLMQEAARMWD
jgi:hypothetical protein